MAQRRMFSPDIVSSEEFLSMPVSSRELYFQLGMNADDDGFIQPKLVMRLSGATDDDLKVLLAKRFLLPFQSGVVVIKHWLIHNMIRADRYKPTRFQEEKDTLFIKENKAYTDRNPAGLQNGNQMAPQVRLGKVSNTIKKEKVKTPLQDAVSLLELELGIKVPNWGKQARYFKQMTDAGYTLADIKNTIYAMSHDQYFIQVGSFDLMTVCNNIARFKKQGFKSIQINTRQQPKGDNERMLEKLYAA